MTGQIQLSEAQVKALSTLATEHLGDAGAGALLTDQGDGDVYVAFGEASFTITSKGVVSEEEFG